MEYRLTLRHDVAELTRLSAWLADLKNPGTLSDRDLFRLDLTLNEAITNVMDYSTPEAAAAGEVTVRLVLAPEEITVTVIDQGKPFDPLSGPKKRLPSRLEDATPGGLGIHLIRNYTDSCSYERNGETNRLTMVFRRTPPAAVQG